MPAETITVVLSKLGWIRAAKNEIEGSSLNYRGNDAFHLQVIGKNNATLLVIDHQGKSYTLNARELPGARGHGDPISSYINIPDKTQFNNLLLAKEGEYYLLASSDAYGFIAPFADLCTRNKAGKHCVNLSTGASLLPAQKVTDADHLVCVSSVGNLLIFPLDQVAQLSRGKGHRLMNVKSKDGETLQHVQLMQSGAGFTRY